MSIRYTRKDGKPSAYEFACGAYLQVEPTAGILLEIIKPASSYYVRAWKRSSPGDTLREGSFDRVKGAWTFFNSLKRSIKRGELY